MHQVMVLTYVWWRSFETELLLAPVIPVSPDHTDCENVGIHSEASSTGPDQKRSLSIHYYYYYEIVHEVQKYTEKNIDIIKIKIIKLTP